MNIRICLLLLLILLQVQAAAQKNYYTYFNTDAFWQKLVRDPAGPIPALSANDTAFVVATNRLMAPDDQLRFISEVREADSVRFYTVYVRGNHWHLIMQPSLRHAVASLPRADNDWVIYAEGMGKIFTTDLDRGVGMAAQYGVNVLLLDYPSIRSDYKPLRNYWFVMHQSNIAYRDFAPVLDSFRHLRKEGIAGKGKLTLFFHSMGNNVMRKLAQPKMLRRYNDAVWVDNLVLNAPCVPSAGSTDWINDIRFAKRIYVHYNPEDFTLRWARLVSIHGILGERPDPPLSDNAHYINFNTLCGRGHSNFLNLHGRPPSPPEAIEYYNILLHGNSISLPGNGSFRKSAYRQGSWDILPRSMRGMAAH